MSDTPEPAARSGQSRRASRWWRMGCLLALAAPIIIVLALALGVARGHHLSAVKWLASHLQTRMDGQQTRRMQIDIAVHPRGRRIDATATLTVASAESGRRHFYFLLNPSLDVKRVTSSGARCGILRTWLITRITLPKPARAGAEINLEFRYGGDPTGGFGSVAAGYLRENAVLLNVDEFWYPCDLQSFFDVELTVELPASLTLVTTGAVVERGGTESVARIRQVWPRPLGGLALVAGEFTVAERRVGDTQYAAYLPQGWGLDRERLLDAMQESQEAFTAWFGDCAFRRHALVLLPDVYRGFNDGSAVMGLAPRYFRRGDYGYVTIAHEMAHNWWGSVVAERWLDPGTGGEWIVEGFAEMSALWLAERRFGPGVWGREGPAHLFPPDDHRPVAAMSVLDNMLGGPSSRWTIYQKGAAVATLLRRTLGDDAFAQVCARFCERYRYAHVASAQFATLATELTGMNFDVFFARWVDGADTLDLAISPGPEAPLSAVVRSLGEIRPHLSVAVALERADERALYTVAPADLGAVQPRVLADPDTRVIVDPEFAWPDVHRSNNVWPQTPPLRWEVPAPVGERSATVRGLPLDWEPHQITLHGGPWQDMTYDFPRAPTGPPVWWPDGRWLIVSVAPPVGRTEGTLVLLAAKPDLSKPISDRAHQQRIGAGRDPVPFDLKRQTLLCSIDGKLFEQRIAGRLRQHLAVRGWTLTAPRVSPNGTHVLCTGTRGARAALWVWDAANPEAARTVLEVPRDRLEGWWLPGGASALVLQPRDERTVLSRVSIEDGSVVDLVTSKPRIEDVLVTPEGRVLFTAAETHDYPAMATSLYALDPDTGQIRRLHTVDEQPGDRIVLPRWAPHARTIVCVRERPIPEFPSPLWAHREVLHIAPPAGD